MSVELALLNHVVSSRDFSVLVRAGLADESTWNEYPEAYRFIHDHVREHGETPSIESIVEASEMRRWPNVFERYESTESFKTLVAKKFDNDAKVATERLLRSVAKEFGTTSGSEMVAKLSQGLRQINDRLSLRTSGAINWTTTGDERLNDYTVKREMGFVEETIPLFWSQIDDAVGGFKRKNYVTVAAAMKRGKTWLATIVAEAASRAGFDVLMLAGEGNAKEVETRLDTYTFEVNSRRLEKYDLKDDEMDRYKRGLQSLKTSGRGNVVIEDYSSWPHGLTCEQIEASILKHKSAVVVVDQFQHMKGSKKWDEQQERSEFLRELFARLDVLGVVIVQAGGDYVKETTRDAADEASRELRLPSAGDYSGTIATLRDCTHLVTMDSVQWKDEIDGKWRGKALAGIALSRTGGAGTSVDLEWSPGDGIIRPRAARSVEDAF